MGDLELERLAQKLRFRVAFEIGFACPDVEDLAQETLRRFLSASQTNQIHSLEAAAAFVNGICRNVIAEYRRRLFRDGPMPETVPEQPDRALSEASRFILRQAIDEAMKELSPRDRMVLQSFYVEERSAEDIAKLSGLTPENLRVVLCRAKEKFRQIYSRSVQYPGASRH